MRVFGKRYTALDVPSGADMVIAGYPIPRGGILRNVWGDVHLVCAAEKPVQQAVFYGLTGYIVKMPDPDTVVTLQTLWDTAIEKASTGLSNASLDLDTVDVTSDPEFEPGEMKVGKLFDVGVAPVEIFKRRTLVSFAKTPVGYEVIAGDEDLYIPTDHFKVRVNRSYRVDSPSYVLFGLSSPTLDRVDASFPTTLTEEQWTQYTYLQETLVDAQKFMIGGGLIDAGAESPYDKAVLLIERLTTQDIFEQGAGEFAHVEWATKSAWSFEVSLKGTMEVPTVAAAP